MDRQKCNIEIESCKSSTIYQILLNTNIEKHLELYKH